MRFFYLNADSDPGSHTNADPDLDPGLTLPSQKVESSMKKIPYVSDCSHM